jgi:hypothetical protein
MKTHALAGYVPKAQKHRILSNFTKAEPLTSHRCLQRIAERWMDAGNIARGILHAGAKSPKYFWGA